MRAVWVLRFSGPTEGRDALLALARREGTDAVEIPGRTRPDESWIEFAIPVAGSPYTDVEQLARSLERSVERSGAGFRLREYLTEVRRMPAPGPAPSPTTAEPPPEGRQPDRPS